MGHFYFILLVNYTIQLLNHNSFIFQEWLLYFLRQINAEDLSQEFH